MGRVATKTTKEKKQDGTFRSSDKPKVKPQSKGDSFNLEPTFALGIIALKFFDTQGTILKEKGILQETDLPLLTLSSKSYEDLINLETLFSQEQDLNELTKLLRLKNTLQKSFLEYCKSLGLSPDSRKKLNFIDEDEEDEFSKFFES